MSTSPTPRPSSRTISTSTARLHSTKPFLPPKPGGGRSRAHSRGRFQGHGRSPGHGPHRLCGEHTRPRRGAARAGARTCLSTTKRRSAMTPKQNFAEQIKAQSDIWRAQTKDYQERLEQAGEQARAGYKKPWSRWKQRFRTRQSLPSRSGAPTKPPGKIWSPPARRHSPSFSGAGRTLCPGFSDHR